MDGSCVYVAKSPSSFAPTTFVLLTASGTDGLNVSVSLFNAAESYPDVPVLLLVLDELVVLLVELVVGERSQGDVMVMVIENWSPAPPTIS